MADSFTMVLGNDPANTGRLASFKPDEWNLGVAKHPTDPWPPIPDYGHETRPRNAYVNFLIKT